MAARNTRAHIAGMMTLAIGGLVLAPPAHALTDEGEDIEKQADSLTSDKADGLDLLVFPVPISNPTSGAGLALGALGFYNPNDAPTPWITGVGAVYTENGTRGIGAFHSMSLDDDRYRIRLIGVHGDAKKRFYGIGAEAGDRDKFIHLDDKVTMIRLQGQVRVAPHFYIGPRFEYRSERNRLDPDDDTPPTELPPIPPPDLGIGTDLSSLGLALSYDRRDDSLNPRRGIYVASYLGFNLKALGSDYSHNRFTLAGSIYRPLGDKTVFAARTSLCAVSDGAPFFDLCNFGAGGDLRGYTAGRYRDRASWAIQAEVRQHLFGRFGGVVFAGVGGIAPKLGDIGDSRLLPAAGAGIRFLVSKSNNVNLRVDFAVGRDSHGLYVGVGESF